MRILHVIPAVASRYGGPSAAVLGMCRALEMRGVSTTIATTNADGPRTLGVPLNQLTRFEDVPAMFFQRRFSESF